MNIHMVMAEIDPRYAFQLPAILRSARDTASCNFSGSIMSAK